MKTHVSLMLPHPSPRLPVVGEFFPDYISWGEKISNPHPLIEEFPAVNQGSGLIAISVATGEWL